MSKTHFIVVARHGDYDDDTGDLSHLGRSQAAAMGKELRKRFGDQTIAVMHSPVLRTQQSGELISGELGIESGAMPDLFSACGYEPRGMDRVWAKAQTAFAEGTQVVVLVTHYEYTEFFPRFAAQQLGFDKQVFPQKPCPKGGAYLLELEAGTCALLLPPRE